jgi:hypothetical protein
MSMEQRCDGDRGLRYAGGAIAFETSVVEGGFMIHVATNNRPWIVIVEPDVDVSLLVAVTAYGLSE